MNVTRVPGATVMRCGLTPAAVIVIVVVATGGLPPVPPVPPVPPDPPEPPEFDGDVGEELPHATLAAAMHTINAR
jgi:hypothetical protein